ncbi:pirin family protein [Desulfomicrobium baculatum]|uniref:Pirin domain protein n=1 Tax=Desulfomicrobium baculatum (strain DSM 4028 / VKM B-1378 / X) TaxID=525897 RepID=C7LQ44_DESBD|nr:pirin family protein [Desulfomicrobium baculatum]ACU89070.1 Pirin domain protein [Desulfomicrobium baculatum DSM 4028]
MRRAIKAIYKGEPVTEGAGVKLRRIFGYYEAPEFDPFLLFDDFRSDKPEDFKRGFPWHPHRGIETITYVIKGDVEHDDSLGNTGIISSGDVQWMTAGSGIVHQEMPKGDPNGSMHGFQLWANLPAAEKMMAPRYRGLTAAQIPQTTLADGTRIKVIAGQVEGVHGPMDDIVIQPRYLDCDVPAETGFTHTLPDNHTAFIYVIEGAGAVEGQAVANRDLVLFGPGDSLAVEAGPEGIRFLLISGRPLGEPIAWRGPIVMNTKAELELAFKEYHEGTFIKHPVNQPL